MKGILKKYNLIRYISFFFYVLRIFPIKNNKILCMNFNGKGFGDSPKYIVKKLLENKKSLDIVWVTNDKTDMPNNVRIVKPQSLEFIFEMVTSKVWISNSRLPLYVRKRKKQYYIQTWHSPLRIKKIELDAKDGLDSNYLNIIKNDSKMIDLMISGCDFSYEIYKRAFGYEGEIIKTGTPRCDVFFNKSEIDRIKNIIINKYNIESSNKIILYAPTFRKNMVLEDWILDINYISRALGDDYTIMLRFHPNTNVQNLEIGDTHIINVSSYPDIQELLCAADILITDYSSCCFDMLIAGKKCILFTKDYNEYLKKERETYFKIDELPFFMINKEKKVVELILEDKFVEKDNDVNDFKQKINLYEYGNASERIVDIILNTIEEGEML